MIIYHKPIEIDNHIYLGSFDVAGYSTIKAMNITAVVCLANESHIYPDDINLYHINDISNDLSSDSFTLDKLLRGVAFIEQQTSVGKNVLVHCVAGSSRSPTLIIAYFIKTRGMTVTEACKFVQSKASHINPTYMDLLNQYYYYLH